MSVAAELQRDFLREHYEPGRFERVGAHFNRFGRQDKAKTAHGPIFIDEDLSHRLITSGQEIAMQAVSPHVTTVVDGYIPTAMRAPEAGSHPKLLCTDFAIVRGEDGIHEPRLIEMQGGSAPYMYFMMLGEQYKEAYGLGDDHQYLFQSNTADQALAQFGDFLKAGCPAENVVLTEINPANQIYIQAFRAFEEATGIKTVDILDVRQNGRDLYYIDPEGRERQIQQVYNRVIPEELVRKGLDSDLQFSYADEHSARFMEHPHWFFGMSKASLPGITHPSAPDAHFLHHLEGKTKDLDLSEYVLKPLFAFGGAGVQVNITQENIDEIPEDRRHEYMLQKKVAYDPFMQDPSGHAYKAEVRVMYQWPEGAEKPEPVVMMGRAARAQAELTNISNAKFGPEDNWIGLAPVFTVHGTKKAQEVVPHLPEGTTGRKRINDRGSGLGL